MRCIALFCLFFISIIATGQSPIPVDSIYSLIKKRSIHREKVDWAFIDKSFHEKLRTSKKQEDTIKSLLFVLESLGDVHSQITFNNRPYGNYPDFDDETLKYLTPLVQRSNEETGKIRTRIIDGSFGYIQIPGFQAWGDKINEYAQAMSDSICSLSDKNIKGYILDLRLNGGGQLAVMLAGLSSLLGDKYIGGGVDFKGNETQRFEISNSNFILNGNIMTNIKNKCSDGLSKIPVTLIIGPATRSSGSITAAAFKGRPNTYFVGEPTAEGYTTGNDFFYFTPSLNINLSVSNTIDRNKKVYENSVGPDLLIKGADNFEDLDNDEKVKTALKWLIKNDR